MPQMIPQMLMQIAGPLLGAVAGPQGPQGTDKQFSNEELIKQLTQSTQQQAGTKAFDMFDEAIEDPRFAAFRQGLLPKFEEEFERVQQPIFGEGVRAGTLQDINEQFAGVSDRIAQQGAARGQLGSGLMPQMELEAELAGAGQRASFLGQLPLLEEQSRRTATAGLLGQGAQFAGRAPISTRRTGVEEFETFAESQERLERERTASGAESTRIQQPSLFSRLLSTGGGLLAGGAFNPLLNRARGGGGDPFGGQNLGFGQRGDFSIALPKVQFGG
jgi:hypothetical protein